MPQDGVNMTTTNETERYALRSFIRAASELSASPYFSEDEPRGISQEVDKRGKARWRIRVGDEHIFRSALWPFRRIWMQGEPANFFNICNIAHRCSDHQRRAFVVQLRKQHSKLQRQDRNFPYPFKPSSESPARSLADIVNLYLNTRFAHAGSKNKGARSAGKFAEADLHAFENDVGASEGEFMFRLAVFEFGLIYISTMWLAQSIIGEPQHCPGGSSADSATDNKERPPRALITRHSPGYSRSETRSETVDRLLARSRMRNLNSMLGQLGRSPEDIVTALDHDWGIEQIASQAGFRLVTGDSAPDDSTVFSIWLDEETRSVCRLAMLRESRTIRASSSAMMCLSKQLAEFKRLVAAEKSKRGQNALD